MYEATFENLKLKVRWMATWLRWQTMEHYRRVVCPSLKNPNEVLDALRSYQLIDVEPVFNASKAEMTFETTLATCGCISNPDGSIEMYFQVHRCTGLLQIFCRHDYAVVGWALGDSQVSLVAKHTRSPRDKDVEMIAALMLNAVLCADR